MTDAPILYCSICDGCVQTCVEIIDRSRTEAGEAEYLSWSVAA